MTTKLLNNCFYIGALIAAGITLGTSKWESTWAWRAPSFFQGIFSVICLLFLPFIPESPRWLVSRDRYEDARLVVALSNSNGDLQDPVAMAVYKQIIDTLEWEKKEGRTMSPKEIFKTPTALKRVLIGGSAGPFSCIAGNIIASYYLGDELQTAGINSADDQLKAVRYVQLPSTSQFKTARLTSIPNRTSCSTSGASSVVFWVLSWQMSGVASLLHWFPNLYLLYVFSSLAACPKCTKMTRLVRHKALYMAMLQLCFFSRASTPSLGHHSSRYTHLKS